MEKYLPIFAASVVDTKTIIHLVVGCIIVKYTYSLRHRKCGVRGYIQELFVSKPERVRYERVRAFHTNNE